MTTREIAERIVNKEIKLNPTFIKANNLTEDEVKAIQDEVKAIKATERENAFKAGRCCIEYKGQVMAFAPKLVEGSEVIVFKTLDKNAIVYCHTDEEGKVAVESVPCCSEKAREYSLRKAEVSANKNKVCKVLLDATVNMEFKTFLDLCATYKGYSVVKATGVLKTIIG